MKLFLGEYFLRPDRTFYKTGGEKPYMLPNRTGGPMGARANIVARANILVVAGNRLLREALARVLKNRGDYHVEAVPFTPDLATGLSGLAAEVVILDSVTVSLAGPALIRVATNSPSHPKVLLIGMPQDEQLFLNCVRAGAEGYVLEDASASDVLAAARALLGGQSVCPPSLCNVLFSQIARPRSPVSSIQVRLRLGLTRRERQLVPLIAQGLTNKEIGASLKISEQTVKNHVHRMLQKVGANDRMAVVDLCRNQGLDLF